METFLGVPVMIRGEAYGNLYLTEKQDGQFDEADEEAAMILADFAAIAIQNARLYTQAESRRSELERAVRRLEASTEIARALEGDMELSHMLELIAKRGRAIVDVPWIAILLADECAARSGRRRRRPRSLAGGDAAGPAKAVRDRVAASPTELSGRTCGCPGRSRDCR